MKSIKFMILLLLIMTLFISGCGQQGTGKVGLISSPYKQTAFLMGTVVTVKIYDKDKNDVLETVFTRIEDLANQITVNEGESEVEKINTNAGKQPIKVSEDIFTLIKAGKTYSEKAEGSFDVTIGPLTSLWRIGFDDAKKPEQSEIDAVLPLVDYSQLQLNEAEQTVFLKKEGMKLDLGAIAKGFIADEAVQVLKEHEVTTAIIDLGGNIYVLGNNPSGSEWTVGVQDPFSPRGEIVGRLPESNKSVVTSGVYERYVEVDGVKYHHLLNPKDGYPFNNEIAGVTIISDYSIDGDALSTSIFSKGLQGGMEYIEQFDGVEAVFVSHDKKVYVTSGLVDDFELTNDSFEIAD